MGRAVIEIGSADAPAILGISRWETPWQCWARFVGLVESKESDEVMDSGKRLENLVLDMELEEFGLDMLALRQWTVRHHKREWQRATPDAVAINDYGAPAWLAETKCLVNQPPPAPRVADVVQCLHQLLVFEQAESNRLIYFGGLRRERFIIPRHQAAMDRVLRAEEAFLEMVVKEIPPPVVAADCDSLWRGWPLVRDEVCELPPEALAWDLMALEAGREMEDSKERYDWARAQIKAAMGDAMHGVMPDGTRYSWRPDKNGRRTLKRRGD